MDESESLDRARWQKLKQLLADALEHPTGDRQAFIDEASVGDAALHAELSALAAAASATDSLLDEPPADLALDALLARSERSWIGRRVGAYRLVSLLGGGGMGQVYLAERADGQYVQQVAVKLMREGLDRPGLEARFKAERQILASLDHPNLAKLLDGGITDEGVPYFVMELVAGEPIDVYCKARNLSLPERLQLFRTVCQVAHYAHRQGVVHRDLKPANVLVARDGVVKLVDFGIAKQITAPSPATATVQRVMTLEYASPEQVRGEPVTPASDIFSLGVVLYRLLTGASPYPASTTGSAYELSKAICDTEPAPPSTGIATRPLRKQLKGDLDAVVMMALRKDPPHRYASAEALADDVFRHLEGLPVQARRGAWSYRAGRFVLRHRAAVGAALLANLVLAAGLSFAAYEAFEAHRQKQRAERHFASVRKLANIFIVDVDQAIRPLAGANPARKLVVEEALAYLKELSAEATDDPSLLVELAYGYRKVGDIQGKPYRSNLNDPKGAEDSYHKAIALVEPLASERNDGPQRRLAQSELAQDYQVMGALLAWLGRSKEALPLFAKASELAESVAAAEPANPDHRRVAAVVLDHRARAHLYEKDYPGFLRASDGAINAYESLLKQLPGDPDATKGLANVRNTRGLYHLERATTTESARDAASEFEKSMQLLKPLHEKAPQDAFLAGQFAGKLLNLGLALNLLQSYEQARAVLVQAIGVLERIVAKDPSDEDSKLTIGMARTALATTFMGQGKPAESLRAAEQADAVYRALPEAARNATEALIAQRDNYHALAAAALALGRSREPDACRYGRMGLEVAQRLATTVGLGPGEFGPDSFREGLRGCPATPP